MSDTRKLKTTKCLTGTPSGEKKNNLFENVKANTQPALDEIPGIPMEIKAEDAIYTNETPDGTSQIIDKKTGKVIGQLHPDGTIVKKLDAMDRQKNKNDLDR